MANNTLSGSGSSLSYRGVGSPYPPNLVAIARMPTTNDYFNFTLGDIWLDTATNIPYMLVDKAAGIATWTPFAGSDGASNFVTDSGTATEVGGFINVLGGELINIAGAGSTVTTNLDRGTNGQIIIAATGAPSAYGSLTSMGGTITVSGGANTLNIDTAASVAVQFDGDSGTSTPALGIENLIGATGANITTVASSNQVTFAVSGTTDHAIQLGDATGSLNSLTLGTTGQMITGNTGADPSWITAGSNGQVIVGSTGALPAFATLTSTGGTITFTPGANTLNLESHAPEESVAFFAHVGTTVNNVTGASTNYVPIFNTEVYDLGSNFNPATGVFTAPSDGIYQFNCTLSFNNLTAAMTSIFFNFTVAGTGPFNGVSISQHRSNVFATAGGGIWRSPGMVSVQLDAADTVEVHVQIDGGAGDTASIMGTDAGTDYKTTFSGYRVATL